jgi:hypothetical protein
MDAWLIVVHVWPFAEAHQQTPRVAANVKRAQVYLSN